MLFRSLEALRETKTRSADKPPSVSIYYLSYRPEASEAGSERTFDYSAGMIARRWQAGKDDMEAALRLHARSASREIVNLIPVRREAAGAPTERAARRGRRAS